MRRGSYTAASTMLRRAVLRTASSRSGAQPRGVATRVTGIAPTHSGGCPVTAIADLLDVPTSADAPTVAPAQQRRGAASHPAPELPAPRPDGRANRAARAALCALP